MVFSPIHDGLRNKIRKEYGQVFHEARFVINPDIMLFLLFGSKIFFLL